MKVQAENVVTLKQIRSLLTDAARLTGQVRQQERGDRTKMTALEARLLHFETVMDQLREDLSAIE